MVEDFTKALTAKLTKLQDEVMAYESDELFQKTPPGVQNSAEVLSKHIIGNLNWFVGAQLGGTGYVRDREAEFLPGEYTRETIYDSIADTKDMLSKVLGELWNEDLTKIYPIPFKEHEVTIHAMLLTLTSHLDYHLGQINYGRRIAAD